jgi:hypothetical protein
MARSSQEVTKRFYNLLAVNEAGACRPCEAGVGSDSGNEVLSV